MAKRQRKGIFWQAAVAGAALVFLLTGCRKETNGIPPRQESQPESSSTILEVQDIGEGETSFSFYVADQEGKETLWEVHTDQETVGAALLEAGLIEGEESQYGLYVKTVNGITADPDSGKDYWAFYVDGEYAVTGVDSTAIEPGKTYGFVYTKG